MENDHPFISQYDRCDLCRNWYRIDLREFRTYPLIRVHLGCGHIIKRDYYPLMDGPFPNKEDPK